MIGDVQDFVRRMRAVFPRGWLANIAPTMEVVLGSLSQAWASLFTLLTCVRRLTRIHTSYGLFLDLEADDFFGDSLRRLSEESDGGFVTRIFSELLRVRVTRSALANALIGLTGRTPVIVEPARPQDTGGYTLGGVGYGVVGAWGNLNMKHCCFVTAFRPSGRGISNIAGYCTGGPLVYGNKSMIAAQINDADISRVVAAILPVGVVAWLRIET